MLRFIIRRVLVGLGILVVASALIYAMASIATDINALKDLEQDSSPQKVQKIADRTALLHLNDPWYERYVAWLGQIVRGNWGTAWRTNTPVSDLLSAALASTFQLVSAATVLALLLGVAMGIVSALRQYSSFDYIITFFSFLMYSLPSFWVAVLLKQFLAIGFNDFLASDGLHWTAILGISLGIGVFWSLALGGVVRKRVINGLSAAAISAAVLVFLNITNWWNSPRIGIGILIVTGIGVAVGVTTLSTGLKNRRSLYTALTNVAIAVALYFPIQTVFTKLTPNMAWWILIVGFFACLVVGVLVGWLWGGPDRVQSMRTGAIVAPIMGLLLVADKVLSYWGPYSKALNGRPIPTIGDRTPNLGGNFWVTMLDLGTHLVLPTLALMLISFAGYTRYSRGSMLEVMGQDYIRTARAKGLPERTVVMRHGFRNSLIPLATLVPLDIIGLIGGAIITEQIFGRPGMGSLFINSLNQGEIEPLMAYVMITAAAAVVANIIADLVYAALDPRIRVDA